MSASVHGDGGRPGLRWVLAIVLLISLYGVVENFFLIPPPEDSPAWSPAWLVTLDGLVWPIVALCGLALVGIAGLARGKRTQLWFGLLALVAMAVLVEAMAAHVGEHRRRFYSVGAALFGWLCGLIFARSRGANDDRSERLAEAGAAAALAATYANAGLQKLMAGGLFDDHSFQIYVLHHHHIDDTSIIGRIAQLVVTHPQIGVGLALSVVVIQAGAWIYLTGPRGRMIWGTLLISFHVGTLAFLHIMYVMATVLLVAWSYPWARVFARVLRRPAPPVSVADDPPLSARELAMLAGVGALLVALAWIAPTPHSLGSAESNEPPHVPASTPPTNTDSSDGGGE
ncbi:hypothetical protein DB30_03649 [Enhygromyxa salina]|uniref:Uncharacterized protein n=1 Tax=Enhygromyxa salina TaxID=215803 RepID=A0A0C2DB54_9BACT|nr:hypothetical protein [Enhygromyxa salina]KIG17052.1 hypothetical protein DB30_03649 [Enhygromyxa salina]